MLTTNVTVSDGLVNGARGIVVDIICNDNDKVSNVLVVFDNSDVGVDAIHSSPFRSSFPRAVKYNFLLWVNEVLKLRVYNFL